MTSTTAVRLVATPDLNEAQRAAAAHRGGPLLVEAGPGSGKTRVIVERVVSLCDDGIAPDKVLAITFTNRAAQEMRRRIAQRIGFDHARRMWICTFHSACAKMLRDDGPQVGVPTGFKIADSAASLRLCRQVIASLGLHPGAYPARRVRSQIAAAKNDGYTADAYMAAAAADDAHFEMAATAEIFDQYQRRLAADQGIDFEDLLLYTDMLLTEHPAATGRWRSRFGHVLVDEYQDTNLLQNRIALSLTADSGALTAVGDSDQAIYGFRGADPTNIELLTERVPDVTVMALEDNYRSSGNIVAAANALIAANPRRHPKRLRTSRPAGDRIVVAACRDEHHEADTVAADAAARIAAGTAHGEIAVLYRTNAQSRCLEQSFAAAGIPCRVRGGVPFHQRREVADAVAHLRAAANPNDDTAVGRAVNAPPRGVGPKAAAALSTYAASIGGSLIDALASPAAAGLWPAAADGCAAYLDIHRCITAAAAQGAAAAAAASIEDSGLRAAITAEDTYDTPERLANLDELLASAAEHDTLEAFLSDIDRHSAADTPVAGRAVDLLTIHTAKGLEYPVVYLTGCEEGLLPHALRCDPDSYLAEERRLAYVAVTRAADTLVVSHAAKRALLRGTAAPSRFLDELPERLLLHITPSDGTPGLACSPG